MLVAAAFRFASLGEIPPGFQFDEAYNAIDAAAVLDGRFQIFFPANGGREPLVTYLHAAFLAIVGPDRPVLALRLVSAFVGIVTVPLTAWAVGRITTRRVGILAAAFLAVTYWHLHFSRYGIRAILAPAWTALALGTWWRSISGSATDGPLRRWGYAALCGVFLVAAVYSHPSGRLLPFILIGHAAFRARAGHLRADLIRLTIAGSVALVLFLPLGRHFIAHPTDFTGHPADVSIFAVADARHGGDVPAALLANAGHVAGMLFVAGDPSTFHNLPGLPVFDPLTALAAVLGLGALGAAALKRRPGAILLLLWLGVGLLPTLLSDRPPNYSRAIATLPIVVGLPAVGLVWLTRGLGRRKRAAVLGSVWCVGTVWAGWHYFVAFPGLDHVDLSYDVDKVDALAVLTARSATDSVYLAPLWAEHATIAYLNADGPVGRLGASSSLAVPDLRRPVTVAFPAEQEELADSAQDFLRHSASRELVRDGRGRPLMHLLRVPPEAWGDLSPPSDAPLEPDRWSGARFGHAPMVDSAPPTVDSAPPTVDAGPTGADRHPRAPAIELVGLTHGTPVPGEALEVRLWWRSLSPLDRNLTMFLQATDAAGAPAGQTDTEPAGASLRTSEWPEGLVLIDGVRIDVPAAANLPLTLRLGWYDRHTGDRLPLVAAGALGEPTDGGSALRVPLN